LLKTASVSRQADRDGALPRSVEGPIVAIEPADRERHARPMARRYLGKELGDRYVEATAGEREAAGGSILVRVRPERWLTVDYRKQFAV
jgi:hypothetical protein